MPLSEYFSSELWTLFSWILQSVALMLLGRKLKWQKLWRLLIPGVGYIRLIRRSIRRGGLETEKGRAEIDLWKEELLSGGDHIMVSRNNYFWLEEGFIANGETFEVIISEVNREMANNKNKDLQMKKAKEVLNGNYD